MRYTPQDRACALGDTGEGLRGRAWPNTCAACAQLRTSKSLSTSRRGQTSSHRMEKYRGCCQVSKVLSPFRSGSRRILAETCRGKSVKELIR